MEAVTTITYVITLLNTDTISNDNIKFYNSTKNLPDVNDSPFKVDPSAKSRMNTNISWMVNLAL